jgi:hypothetical protein
MKEKPKLGGVLISMGKPEEEDPKEEDSEDSFDEAIDILAKTLKVSDYEKDAFKNAFKAAVGSC